MTSPRDQVFCAAYHRSAKKAGKGKQARRLQAPQKVFFDPIIYLSSIHLSFLFSQLFSAALFPILYFELSACSALDAQG
jgi:hypothetical protein